MTIYRAAPVGQRLEQAVGNAAVAVRDLPDSSLVIRLTRGRLWIAVLSVMLVGIVALNVLSLGLNVSSGRTGEQIAELERENSALRAQIAQRLSNDRIEAAAASLGLIVPSPADTTYLTSGGRVLHEAGSTSDVPLITDSVEEAPIEPVSSPAPEAYTPAASPTPAPAPEPAPAPTSSGASDGGSSGGGSGLNGGIAPG